MYRSVQAGRRHYGNLFIKLRTVSGEVTQLLETQNGNRRADKPNKICFLSMGPVINRVVKKVERRYFQQILIPVPEQLKQITIFSLWHRFQD